jgi:hypothetical protein
VGGEIGDGATSPAGYRPEMPPYNEGPRNVPLTPHTADALFTDSAYADASHGRRCHRCGVPLMELPA